MLQRILVKRMMMRPMKMAKMLRGITQKELKPLRTKINLMAIKNSRMKSLKN